MRTGTGEKEFSEWLLKLGELTLIILKNSKIYNKIIKRKWSIESRIWRRYN